MIDWPIIGGIIETINWLTITTPFFAGFAVFRWGKEAGEGNVVPSLVGALAFGGLIAVWYVLYRLIEFPLWMGWFQ